MGRECEGVNQAIGMKTFLQSRDGVVDVKRPLQICLCRPWVQELHSRFGHEAQPFPPCRLPSRDGVVGRTTGIGMVCGALRRKRHFAGRQAINYRSKRPDRGGQASTTRDIAPDRGRQASTAGVTERTERVREIRNQRTHVQGFPGLVLQPHVRVRTWSHRWQGL